MPHVSPRSPNAPRVKFISDPAYRGDPRAPDVIHDALKVGSPLHRAALERLYSLRIAYLLSPERTGTVGIA